MQVSDLYAMSWSPVASAADFSTRANPAYLVYALEQRLGASTQSLSGDIQQELDKLLWADLLILDFPIYWFSMRRCSRAGSIGYWFPASAMAVSAFTIKAASPEKKYW